MLNNLNDIVSDSLNKLGYQSLANLNYLKKNWSILVGDQLASKTIPFKLKNQQLTVLLEDAAYISHMVNLQDNLLALIKVLFKFDKVVTKINYMVGYFQNFQMQTTAEKSTKKIESYSINEELEINISNPKLKKAFQRLIASTSNR